MEGGSRGARGGGGCGPRVCNKTQLDIVLYMNMSYNFTIARVFFSLVSNMLFYPTIGSKYFAKTQTYVALFGPHELSLIFAGGMCLEQTSL